MTTKQGPKTRLSERVLRGGIALAVARILVRAGDLIRMLSIARWLGVDEMGVYAVASLALMTLDQFSETGLRLALIQRQGSVSQFVLPIRTVQAIRGLFLGVCMFITAPVVASFFSSPKSVNILRVLAILPAVRGFETLFVTMAQKELRFGAVVTLQCIATVVSLAVGIIAAAIRPDAWAMVWANLCSAVIMTIGSHILSQRSDIGLTFHWKVLKDINGFSFWIFLTTILSYLITKGGDWAVGRLLDARELALYQMAFMMCTVGTAEIGGIVSQLSLPVFSHLQNDKLRLQRAFSQSCGLIAIVIFLMAGLLCSCSADFFSLALGEKWQRATSLVPWLTVWGVCSTLAFCMSGVFLALGKSKLWTQMTVVMAILMAIWIYPMAHWFGARGVAILMAGVGVTMQLTRYVFIGQMLTLSYPKVLSHVIVPGVACILSVLTSRLVRYSLPNQTHIVGLIVSAACLLSSYALLLVVLNPWMEPSPRQLFEQIRQMVSRKSASPVAS